MFRFAHIFFLYGLLLIPVFIFLFALMLRWRKKIAAKIWRLERNTSVNS